MARRACEIVIYIYVYIYRETLVPEKRKPMWIESCKPQKMQA